MFRPFSILTCLGCALLFASCAPSLLPRLERREASLLPPRRVAVLLPRSPYLGRETEGIGSVHDEGPRLLREALQRELTTAGLEVVAPESVDAYLARELQGTRDPTYGQAAGLARHTRADLVLFGRVERYHHGRLWEASTTVSFLLEAVDSLERPLLRLRQSNTAAQEDPADLVGPMAHQSADSLLAVLGLPR